MNKRIFADTATEKITATPHANGKDYWIIAHEANSNRFLLWLLTETGVSGPDLIASGSAHFAPTYKGFGGVFGTMAASPDGSLLAVAVYENSTVELFDFDNATGAITNPRMIVTPQDGATPYSLTFSPGSCYLYAPGHTDTRALFQYDLTGERDAESLRAGRIALERFNQPFGKETYSADYQIGPDSRIYTGRGRGLGRITFPDAKGLACGYDPDYLTDPNQVGVIVYLPNFVDAWFATPGVCGVLDPLRPFTIDTLLCAGETVRLAVPWRRRPDVSVRFSVPGGVLLEVTDTTAMVRYDRPGLKEIGIFWSDPINGADSAIGTITVNGPPNVEAGPQQDICRGDSALLGDRVNLATAPSVRFRWSPAEGLDDSTRARPNASPLNSSTYYLHARDTLSGCEIFDTVRVVVNPLPWVDLGGDTTLCSAGTVELQASTIQLDPATHSFLWTPNDGLDCDTCFAVAALIETSTRYTVHVTNALGCTAVDTVEIVLLGDAFDAAIDDTALCLGSSVVIGRTEVEGMRYQWFPATGLDDPTIGLPTATPLQTTTWVVTVTDTISGCSSIDSVRIEVRDRPVADAGVNRTICAGSTLTLRPKSITSTQEATWSRLDRGREIPLGAGPTPTVTPDSSTTYVLSVLDTRSGCTARDSLRIVVGASFSLDAGPDITLCGEPSGGDVIGPGTPESGLFYQWSPVVGLIDPSGPRTGLTAEAAELYVLTATDSISGCSSIDTVMVNRRDPDLLPIEISPAQVYASIGEPFDLSLVLRDAPTSTAGITELTVEFRYNPSFLLPDNSNLAGTLSGTLLQGWDIEEIVTMPGVIRYSLSGSGGQPLRQSGLLLRSSWRAYLGDSSAGSVVVVVTSKQKCLNITEVPASVVQLDSICGANLRLIEIGVGKYAPPQISPNPGNSPVRIEFGVGLEGRTTLEAFDLTGRRGALLVDEQMGPGFYSIEWKDIATGTYILRLRSGSFVGEERVVIR